MPRIMKDQGGSFDDQTGTWFLQGTNPDQLAELHPQEDAPPQSAWAAMMTRLHHLLRRD